MPYDSSLQFAQRADAADPLRAVRDKFVIPSHNGKESIYFLGNSLGLQPKQTASSIQSVLDTWAVWGVEGFFTGDDPWLNFHDKLIDPLADIVGAKKEELVVMNGLTVNLHLMLVSFYQPKGKRVKIICEAKAFPSDQYMLETHVRQRGFNPEEVIIEVQPRKGSTLICEDDIIQCISEHKEEVALVFWGGVNYYTGQVFNINNITAAAHKVGAIAGFDLAHAAGNVPLQLHGWNVDFACWCSYKYLNAGPGAVAAAFIHERYHSDAALQRFGGWWGYKKETRFLMEKGFNPISTAEGWQLSTPSPIAFAAQMASLQIFADAGLDKVWEKSRKLSAYLFFLLEDEALKNKFTILTPNKEESRGSQVSLLITNGGKTIFDHLTKNGVFADWREPDVIRIAPVPLYNSYTEVWQFVQVLKDAFFATA